MTRTDLRMVRGVVSLAAVVFLAATAAAQRGRIATDTVRASSLTNLLGAPAETRVTVYLPPSYDNSPSVRYPVVYLLHGFGTTDVSWVRGFAGGMGVAGIMDSLVATYAAREMIVVMPNGSTRFGGGFYVNSATSGNWDDFVARDLVAWTDAKYRTLARPESRGIAGHSMGGYGALYLGMRHGGETFGALYAMSACCITPFGFDPARDGATWDTVGQASTPAAIPRAGLGSRAIVALSEAFAPDSTKPPFFMDLAHERHGNEWTSDPAVLVKFREHALLPMLGQFRGNLSRMRAIAFDGGRQDEVVPPQEWMVLDTAMTRASLPHTFETYDGTHVSRVGARLMTSVFSFFSRVLVFGRGAP